MTIRDTPWPAGTPCWVDLMTSDPAAAREFYAELFGWQIDERSRDDFRFSADAGPLIGRFVVGRAPAREPGVSYYVYVDGIEAAIARVTANGGEVVQAPACEGDTWIARIRDPAGNLLGIWQFASR
jgi:predicted enzyme related to lactoylglutathione lyase